MLTLTLWVLYSLDGANGSGLSNLVKQLQKHAIQSQLKGTATIDIEGNIIIEQGGHDEELPSSHTSTWKVVKKCPTRRILSHENHHGGPYPQKGIKHYLKDLKGASKGYHHDPPPHPKTKSGKGGSKSGSSKSGKHSIYD